MYIEHVCWYLCTANIVCTYGCKNSFKAKTVLLFLQRKRRKGNVFPSRKSNNRVYFVFSKISKYVVLGIFPQQSSFPFDIRFFASFSFSQHSGIWYVIKKQSLLQLIIEVVFVIKFESA